MSQSATDNQLPAKQRSALREAFIFCILAYVLSWGWWGFKFAPFLGAFFVSGQPIARSQLGDMDVSIGMFGPMIAAILMRLWISREAFRPSLRLPLKRKAYVFAIAVPFVIAVITVVINQISGLGHFTWGGDTIFSLIGAMLLIIPLSTIAAVGEEYGWRGYLLPRLLPGGEIKATIVMGLIWAMWHLPILVTGLTFPGESLAFAIPVFVFAIVMTSFLFTKLHDISGGSFWTAALLHGTLNALTILTSERHYPDGNQLVLGILGLNYAVILLLGIAVYYLARKRNLVTS
jgi:hypothetical protein